MTITTITSREFNQHPSDAKKASLKGPVFIADRVTQRTLGTMDVIRRRRLAGLHAPVEHAGLLSQPAPQPALPSAQICPGSAPRSSHTRWESGAAQTACASASDFRASVHRTVCAR
jgi:hypothetical protein